MSKIHIFVNNWDMKVLYTINSRIKSNILDKLIPKITNLGSAAFTLILTASLILFGEGKVKFAGIESASALASSSLLVTYLKKKFTRPRPYWIIKDVNSFDLILKDYSFPSGHTSAAFSLATVLSVNFQSYFTLFMLIALMVGFSRVYLAVHFPTDVVMGIIIGITFGLLNVSYHPYFIYNLLS